MIDLLWYPIAVLGGVVGAVVALFVHEFAHAVPVLLAGGSAHITVGSDDGRTWQVGPVTVTFGIDGLRKLIQYGHYRPTGVESERVHAVSILAGPAVTVGIVLLIGVLVYRGVSDPVSFGLLFIFFSELSRAVQTIVPKTYSRGPYAGMDSDGKRFLQVVRT